MIDCYMRIWVLFSAASPKVYYNDYSMLLIPIGILICFVIKKLSDFDSLNRGVSIRACDDVEGVEVLKVDSTLFQSVLTCTKQSSNAMLAVKGMAVELSELANVMTNKTGSAIKELEVFKCQKNMPTYCNAAVHKNLVCVSDTPYREAVARMYYDRAINNGTFSAKKKMRIGEFFKACRFICYSDLSADLIKRYSKIGCIRTGVLNDTERSALVHSENICGKGNALLLFLRLNNRLEVVYC